MHRRESSDPTRKPIRTMAASSLKCPIDVGVRTAADRRRRE
jgi:hypothetical protein